MIRNIILADGIQTLTLFRNARLALSPQYNQQTYELVTGAVTQTYGPLVAGGQQGSLTAYCTNPEYAQLVRWIERGSLLTVTDEIDLTAGTAQLIPEITEELPLRKLDGILARQITCPILFRTITQYRGIIENLPII